MQSHRWSAAIKFAVVLVLTTANYAMCNAQISKDDIYKHYEGTIGSRKVVVELRFGFNGGSNFGGTYVFYTDTREVHRMYIGQPASSAHNAELHSNELLLKDGTDNIIENSIANWIFAIKDQKLTGKWINEAKQKSEDINLTENYSQASPFDVITNNFPGGPKYAYNAFITVVPGENMPKIQATYFRKQLQRWLNIRNTSATTNSELAIGAVEQCLRDHIEMFGGSEDSMKDDFMKSATFHCEIFPISNRDGIVTLEMMRSTQYKEKFTSKICYLCLDLKRQRSWEQKDIISNKEKISTMLEKDYQQAVPASGESPFQMSPAQFKMPENVLPTPDGLIFPITNSGSLFKDETMLFLPYSKIGSSLSIDFKKRIGIK